MKVKRVLLPIDFSPCSTEAINSAVDLARHYQASLDLLHVWQPVMWDTIVPFAGMPVVQEFAHTDSGDRMKELLRVIEGQGITVRGRLEPADDPSNAIVRIAKEESYDLIVMGTHLHSPYAHWFSSSNGEKVARNALCPVLLVRECQGHDDPESGQLETETRAAS